jgi:hypothetical protein
VIGHFALTILNEPRDAIVPLDIGEFTLLAEEHDPTSAAQRAARDLESMVHQAAWPATE